MAQRNRKKMTAIDDSSHGPGWLTTFNDMVTLLMVFFVLLFTMGSLDVKRFKSFQNALQSAMGVLHEGQHAPVGLISEREKPDVQAAAVEQDSLEDQKQFDQLEKTQGLEAQYTPRGIKLTLDDNLLFNSGSATITAAGLNLLNKVSRVVRPIGRHIRVEGHTDNVPIATQRYPSNWELSTHRAINVVKYFIHRGRIEPHFLSAVGYGAAKPRVTNNSNIQRARNRRVEIILGPITEGQHRQ